MSEIRIEPFGASMVADAASVLARAFATSPLHLAAFGSDVLPRSEAFFRRGLEGTQGTSLAAFAGARMIGFVHWADPGERQPTLSEQLRLQPGVINRPGLRAAATWLSWMSAAPPDPAAAHVHLGPVGVLPEWQGRGVGRLLTHSYCEALDATGRAGYLETDRPSNVGFYRRFAFETMREIEVAGVINYLMERPALMR